MKFFVFASLLAVGAFASQCHPDYECCSGCEVVYTDAEGDWGVENRQWCFIGSNCGSNNAVSGYPICNGCQVVYTDADGQWGVENGDWCLIQNGKCGGSNPNPTQTTTFQNVIPVINLISSSGTSDFATQPVETHIAQQAYMGKEMPPAPYYEDCTITIEDADGTAVINGVKGKVKVRGNWTSNYPKKGLRINFEESQSVLGLNNGEKYKNWVLLAEYKDGSMLRNKSAFQVARGVLGGDGYFASDSTLVELKINGEYFGVYLLAEQQQINKGRVDITKGKDDYTGTDIGYLLEFDLGYTMYEDDIQKFTVDFNNNAPLKPYDGNGGSGKTIEPSGGFGFGGGMGFGGNTGMGNFGNWGGFGGQTGQTGQPGQPGQTGGQTVQQPGQAGNTGMGNFGNWGGFGQNANTNTNQGNQQQTGNNWGAQQGGNTNWGAQQGGNTNWGNFGGFGNRGGNNMKKRQFMMGGGDNITIKNDIYSTQQKEFISKFVNNAYNIMYEAAYNQNPLKFTSDYSSVVEAPELTPRQAIENVVEAESLADMFIVSEIACDADLYYSSFYLDVDFGPNGSKKLRFEAPWDFDSALGNKERCTDGKGHFAANITQDNGGMGGQKINPWLAVIMYEDWYQDMIRSRWSKAYDSGVFGKVVDMIHSDTQIAAEAFDRNYSKWDNINNNKQFANELSQGAKQCKTQSEAANFLAKWFEARVAFINSHWHK